MIPLQLTLRNFLSYREATLDFRGLHTACICGSNGAGKSSLLEAITWAMWGKTRAASEDDLIHTGFNDVRVDFQFSNDSQVYRVIRNRRRGSSDDLQLQIAQDNVFCPLSIKGKKATQDKIDECVKLDYETFSNSAYLRQGKADQFMLLKPSDRQKFLANLLKLDQYEELSNKAKEKAHHYKTQLEFFESKTNELRDKISTKGEDKTKLTEIETLLSENEQKKQTITEKLEKLHSQNQEKKQLLEKLNSLKTQSQQSQQDRNRQVQEYQRIESQLQQLNNLLQQEVEITQNYQQFLQLKTTEENLRKKSEAYQNAQQQKRKLEQEIQQKQHQLDLERSNAITSLKELQQREQSVAATLQNWPTVEAGLIKLRQCREHLNQLNQQQQAFIPLREKRESKKLQIETLKARTTAQLNQLKQKIHQLDHQIASLEEKRQALQEVNNAIDHLDKQRNYQERLHQKLQEQVTKTERLGQQLINNQQKVTELLKKLQTLQDSQANCPLCEQALNEHHRQQVVDKTEKEKQTIEQHSWLIEESQNNSQQEIAKLNQQIQSIVTELKKYDRLNQQYGQLENELDNIASLSQEKKKTKKEIHQIETSLANGSYAESLQEELQEVLEKLRQLNYDEQTHSMVREEERNLSKVEIQYRQIKDAQKEQTQINTKKPEIVAKIDNLLAQITSLKENSPLLQQLKEVEAYLSELNYNLSEHNQVIEAVNKTNHYQLKYQELLQAKKEYPQKQEHRERIYNYQQEISGRIQSLEQDIQQITQKLAETGDNQGEINSLEAEKYQIEENIRQLLIEKGVITQSLKELENLEQERQKYISGSEITTTKKRIYDELTKAFGKKGIQALMIENILPYLETETNRILSRLSHNQFHVNFVTQKPRSKSNDQMMETLEIIIADSQGKRSYETYSGGEAFRINFAIRLALSKLLAQRAGASLQLLIIDEGFGTQDQEGCERLIAAINAIANDFSCILTVTHIPQFKEAFQTHIEVFKTPEGSHLTLSQ